MTFLTKYNVARHIYIPLIKAGVNNHAVSADWTPAAGDVKISKDGGATANVTNLPTAIAMGNSTIWDFSLTATELSAAQIMVIVADSVTKAVEDDGFIIETYGNASAEHVFDLSQATPAVNTTQFGGSALTQAAGRPEVNTTHWKGTAAAVEDTVGYPKVTIKDGAGAGEINLTAGAVDAVTTVTNLTNAPTAGDLTATMKTSVKTQVTDGLNVDTYAEVGQEAPAATQTIRKMLGYLYKAWRNKTTQTATVYSLFADDTTTVDQKATVSDDLTTFTRGEVGTGP